MFGNKTDINLRLRFRMQIRKKMNEKIKTFFYFPISKSFHKNTKNQFHFFLTLFQFISK